MSDPENALPPVEIVVPNAAPTKASSEYQSIANSLAQMDEFYVPEAGHSIELVSRARKFTISHKVALARTTQNWPELLRFELLRASVLLGKEPIWIEIKRPVAAEPDVGVIISNNEEDQDDHLLYLAFWLRNSEKDILFLPSLITFNMHQVLPVEKVVEPPKGLNRLIKSMTKEVPFSISDIRRAMSPALTIRASLNTKKILRLMSQSAEDEKPLLDQMSRTALEASVLSLCYLSTLDLHEGYTDV